MPDKDITIDEVRYIAKLSKLEIPEEELKYYAEEMGKILQYFKKLSTIDTSKIEEMSRAVDLKNVVRDDNAEESIDKKDVLDNCPDVFGNYIKVPKILDKD